MPRKHNHYQHIGKKFGQLLILDVKSTKWSEITGIPKTTIKSRLKSNYSIQRTLNPECLK